MSRLLTLLVLVVLIVGAIGFWRGWFNLSADKNTSREVDVHFRVDKDKIRADEEQARQKVRDLGGEAKEAAKKVGENIRDKNDKKIAGTIQKIEPGKSELVLAADGQESRFELTSGATLRINHESTTLRDLKPGDRAEVTYQQEGDKKIATAISARR